MREVRLLRVMPSTLRCRQRVAQVVMLGSRHELVVMVEVASADKVEVERVARLIAVQLRQDVLADEVELWRQVTMPEAELALVDDALEIWFGRQWRTFTGPFADCPQYDWHVRQSRERMRRLIDWLRERMERDSEPS